MGVLLVGLGGNNGSTVTGGILANKHQITWMNNRGLKKPNYYGSITQSSTLKVGVYENQEIFEPMNKVLPMVNPNDIILGGWDISDKNMFEAMKRAQVLDWDLIKNLENHTKDIIPMPAVYYEDFIASNQKSRADHILKGTDKSQHLEEIRKNIRDFKTKNELEKVIILWTANTERFCVLQEGIHDTEENLLQAVERSHPEIAPSQIYAMASILEGCSFINGSPQNTLVPGIIKMAKKRNVFIVGDDFKTGQTKIKTALVEFLVQAGIKPESIVSYNHLGNNDGKNLSQANTFKSKEMSKKSCVDDMLNSNKVLYPEEAKIDHEIVIKYVPFAQDSKKAMDEYVSSIFLNGLHTLVLYNVCEDSLLAAPIIMDLILLTELFSRIQYRIDDEEWKNFNNVLSVLGYLCKAPINDEDTPMINNLWRQKEGLVNIFRACVGLGVEEHSLLEFRAL